MRHVSLLPGGVGMLGVLLAAAVSPAVWALPIPPPGVHAEIVLQDPFGNHSFGSPQSRSDGQPGAALAALGYLTRVEARARLPGSTGSHIFIADGSLQGHSQARQITNWKAIYVGSGPAPAMVEIDVLAVYRGFLTVGPASGCFPTCDFPATGELFASVHAELNIYNPLDFAVTHVFTGDANLDYFQFFEIGQFAPFGAWSGDWTDTQTSTGFPIDTGRADVDTFQVCRATNPLCDTTLVPVDQVFGFEVLIRTEAGAGSFYTAEANFLATLEGTPIISSPDFILVQVPEPATAMLLAFGAPISLGLGLAKRRA